MTNAQIKEKLNSALQKLLKNDNQLIEHDVSERAITHKLAEYLQSEFGDFHVDCEYNRNFGAPKAVKLKEQELPELLRKKFKNQIKKLNEDGLNPDELLSISTYPDIIVHIRNSNEHNLMIIEIKKKDSHVRGEWDDEKLAAFTDKGEDNPYHYQLGVFIEIKTRSADIEWPELTWYPRECQ